MTDELAPSLGIVSLVRLQTSVGLLALRASAWNIKGSLSYRLKLVGRSEHNKLIKIKTNNWFK